MSDSDPRPLGGFFDAAYRETPPWEVGKPQPALLALFDEVPPAGQIRHGHSSTLPPQKTTPELTSGSNPSINTSKPFLPTNRHITPTTGD